MLPNYIGIGAPKAGTTWMARCLGEHPDVFMAAVKETEFWKLADAEQRLPEYEAHFNGGHGKRAVGEFSVRYLSLPGVPERIKRVLPDAKLLICLRNPADQVYSNYWHLQRQNFNLADRSKAPRSIEEAVRDHREFLLGPARYATHLARWYQIFPHDQLLVVLYDDIQTQPAKVMANTFTFLGVDPAFRPPSAVEKGSVVRQGTSPRSEASARWHGYIYGALTQRVYTPMKKMLGTRRAARMKEILRVRPIMERFFMRRGYPAMSDGTRALLAREFASEIEQLAQLTGLNFQMWK